MTSAIPRFIALGWNNRFLQYTLDTKSVRLSSLVVLSAASFTRFEVVRSGTNNLVHIRSSYNKKFMRRSEAGNSVIVPAADVAEEDRSKDSCTLFRAIFSNNRIQLFLQTPNGELVVGLNASQILVSAPATSSSINFEVYDLNTMVLFPRHVSFKGDNGLYLSAFRDWSRGDRLKFSSSNREDPTVHHESFTLPNGDVRLRALSLGGFWRKMNAEWIKCDSQDTTANDSNTVFRSVRRSFTEKTIALLNRGNNKYCMRWIRGGQPKLVDTLTASATTVEPLAVMTVEEAILDREISNIVYNMNEIRIYDEVIDRTVPQTVRNETNEVQHQFLFFTYRELTRETFTSSHSWKVAYQSRLTVSIIPKLVEGEVTIDASYEGNVSWEKTRETDRSVTSGLMVRVAPMTRSFVTGMAKRATIDVPYSYKQRDILLNHQQVVYEMDDGLFSGVNTWLFDYETRDEPLVPGQVWGDDDIVIRPTQAQESKEEEEDERPAGLPSKL